MTLYCSFFVLLFLSVQVGPIQIELSSGVDPGFWSGGPSRVVTPREAWAYDLLKIGGFSLKIAWKLHDF